MRILVDTSVLGRYSQAAHLSHHVAVTAILKLGDAGHDLRLVPQVIYEYWVVATRPADQNGLGMQPDVVFRRINTLVQLFPLLRDERGVFDPWLDLVHTLPCHGKIAHDARLVAAMLRHNVPALLTFNTRDFARFAGIQVLDPAVLAKD